MTSVALIEAAGGTLIAAVNVGGVTRHRYRLQLPSDPIELAAALRTAAAWLRARADVPSPTIPEEL
ncbi:hypothetical protein [Bradyrhizobium sp.]|uniref:hypothetical protein n=1 Tax=Bradyrhizobium sp. TaxID=376 RepID=UPI0025C44076|nr:hypothetical protein [Bradyrhizobium sp.]MCA3256255.1 hypothetical protein [Alphaproteobacteria bacterium]MCA3571926.1 hypothetical protein [Bradyrhizobium sp.]